MVYQNSHRLGHCDWPSIVCQLLFSSFPVAMQRAQSLIAHEIQAPWFEFYRHVVAIVARRGCVSPARASFGPPMLYDPGHFAAATQLTKILETGAACQLPKAAKPPRPAVQDHWYKLSRLPAIPVHVAALLPLCVFDPTAFDSSTCQ